MMMIIILAVAFGVSSFLSLATTIQIIKMMSAAFTANPNINITDHSLSSLDLDVSVCLSFIIYIGVAASSLASLFAQCAKYLAA